MNYIELINKFWQIHEEHSFCTTEIALFFYLLKINNQCSWKESFKRNNCKVEADLGISFNTMKNARQKLQSRKVIDFKSKSGSADVIYFITLSKFDEVGSEVTIEVGSEVGSEVTIEVLPTKDKLNQTKPNQTKKSKSHFENEFSVIEKIENLDLKNKDKPDSKTPEPGPEKNPIFKSMVAVWFEFYKSKFNTKPAFTSMDGGKIKSIQGKLKSKSEEFQSEWTTQVAMDAFRQFLIAAHNEKWLSEHFSLSNLDSQFNSIIVKIINGTVNKSSGNGNSAMAAYKDQLINDLQGT